MAAANPNADLLTELNRNQMYLILTELCKEEEVCARIEQLAKETITQINEETMAQGLFNRLNSIDVVVLWESSGDGYYGYNDPADVAYEMLDSAVEEYRAEMRKFRALNMPEEEIICFRAILRGLQKYAEDGNNEFRSWVPDDPYTLIENAVYDWCNVHPETDEKELRTQFEA